MRNVGAKNTRLGALSAAGVFCYVFWSVFCEKNGKKRAVFDDFPLVKKTVLPYGYNMANLCIYSVIISRKVEKCLFLANTVEHRE